MEHGEGEPETGLVFSIAAKYSEHAPRRTAFLSLRGQAPNFLQFLSNSFPSDYHNHILLQK